MQQKIIIPTDDGHLIYGTLDHQDRKKKLIVFVHGITGNQEEHQFFNAPAFFNSKFETFRFDLYCGEEKARNLSDCTISIHSRDLDTVIKHFEGQYKIYLVGHSLGGPVILRANLEEVQKIVLWDPTRGMQSLDEWDCTFSPELKKYVMHWGQDILVSKEMLDEWKACSDLSKEAQRIKKPCKFIFAGNNPQIHTAWHPILKELKIPSTLVSGATHCFIEEGTERLLFEATLHFFEE